MSDQTRNAAISILTYVRHYNGRYDTKSCKTFLYKFKNITKSTSNIIYIKQCATVQKNLTTEHVAKKMTQQWETSCLVTSNSNVTKLCLSV